MHQYLVEVVLWKLNSFVSWVQFETGGHLTPQQCTPQNPLEVETRTCRFCGKRLGISTTGYNLIFNQFAVQRDDHPIPLATTVLLLTCLNCTIQDFIVEFDYYIEITSELITTVWLSDFMGINCICGLYSSLKHNKIARQQQTCFFNIGSRYGIMSNLNF